MGRTSAVTIGILPLSQENSNFTGGSQRSAAVRARLQASRTDGS
ncbi:hypothetical protein [Synechococcus sp. PCC 7336]|nr:hypothetical protein [Synechococcus sp. PCC 7336]